MKSDGHDEIRSKLTVETRGASQWSDLYRMGEKHGRRGSCPVVVGDTRTHEERLILIRRLSLKEFVDRVVGHDSHGLTRSDDTNRIARCTALIFAEIFL